VLPLPIHWGSESRATTRAWTAYEDQRLLAAIHRLGLGSWDTIARFVGNGRTKAQRSQRWIRGLDPKICKDPWGDGQDGRLVEFVARYGGKSWTRVASEPGNRCDVQCRSRYKQLEKDPGFAQKFAAALESARAAGPCPKPKRAGPKKKAPAHFVDAQPFHCFPQPAWPLAIPQQVQGRRPSQCPPPRPAPNLPRAAETPRAVIPPAEPPQISAHGSAFDWTNACGLSASGSLLGISPMNSFKFEP
jgi:hypothetical protein